MNLPLNSPSSPNSSILMDRRRSPVNFDIVSQSVAQASQISQQPKPQFNTTSLKSSRSRGMVLTKQGWQKLMQAGALCNHYGDRYTYEILAGQSTLSPRTVSKILNCSQPVDKRTLMIFFDAFHLQLELNDYIIYKSAVAEQTADSMKQHQEPNHYATELHLLMEEFMLLKKRLEEYSQHCNIPYGIEPG